MWFSMIDEDLAFAGYCCFVASVERHVSPIRKSGMVILKYTIIDKTSRERYPLSRLNTGPTDGLWVGIFFYFI